MFKFTRGGSISELNIAYETWGKINKDKSNVVVIFTGLSASSHVTSSSLDQSPGWWESMVGKNKAINTDEFYIVCVNKLGSCFGYTSPVTINEKTGDPYRLTFPELTIEDMANASELLLDKIGISKIKLLIGPSMGGMKAIAFSLLSKKFGSVTIKNETHFHGDISKQNLLEVGSGRGGGSSYIQRYLKTETVTGLDISSDAVQLSNSSFDTPGLTFVQGDSENLPFENAVFDAVLNVESSHCYGNITLFLTEVKRVLKPGGFFLWADFRLTKEMSILFNCFFVCFIMNFKNSFILLG
mgnify:CR=1 FL=1